jgi:phage tail sheath gpL-like
MSISFNSIPINLLTPGQYIEFDNSNAVNGLPVERPRVLIIGQKFGGGAALLTAYPIISADQARQAFGARSMLAKMLAAFIAICPTAELWAMPVGSAGGAVSATGTITITGTATAAGTLTAYLGGIPVSVAVAVGDTAAAVGTALAAAITANNDTLVSATSAAGVITLTSRSAGEAFNQVDVRTLYYPNDVIPAGLTVTNSVMAGGTGNPDMSTVVNAIGDTKFDTIVIPYTDTANLTAMEGLMLQRFGPTVQKEGMLYTAASGTVGVLQTLGTSRNNQCEVIVGTGKSPTPPWIWAASVAALDTNETDPARPRQTLTIPGVLPPQLPQVWIGDDRRTLLFSGISTFKVARDGTCSIERLVTTYALNAYGFPDISYRNLETLRTLYYLRFTTRARFAQKYPRHKLADDGTVIAPGQPIITPKIARAEMIALFQDWMAAGLTEDLDQFKRDLVMQRNASDPDRLDAVIPPNTVNQFRVFAGQIGFRL